MNQTATKNLVAFLASLTLLTAASAASANEMAVGLAADRNLTFSSTALTGMTSLDPEDHLQGFFSIADTNPLNINFAALFKHYLGDHQGIGLHVGGGAGIGAASTGGGGNGFALSLTAIGGVHFAVPGVPSLAIHLDAGPVFQTVDGNSDFHIGALSAALGLSVLYFF